MGDSLNRLDAALTGRYRIERELGRGGMATVYLAEDLKHRRRVAIKVLKPELSQALPAERFLREIDAAAQLTHPNIVPLYDSGSADGLLYYVMPYIEGESLRDRLGREGQLPLDEALQLTREVVGALSYAHSKGLIHRDVKPENILVQAGHAVVSDFGISRAVGSASGERLTESGFAVGTPTYMSPEQASGERDIDERTDVYGAGCVLYEMLAGCPPYTGPNAQAILARKAIDPLPSLRTVRDVVPVRLEQVIAKSLAKSPADRYASAEQFGTALREAVVSSGPDVVGPPAPVAGRSMRWLPIGRRRVVAPAAAIATLLIVAGAGWTFGLIPGVGSDINSLAVLPFENIGRDTSQAFFVAGVHDALIGELAQIGSLRVISRTSTARYEGSNKSAGEIARELDVSGIVSGSVQRDGNGLRVQVQLIRPLPTERQLWTKVYDRDVRDVFSLYSDMARAIAREIRTRVTREEQTRLASVRRVQPDSYEAYLKGMFYLSRSGPEAARQGLALFHEAVERDPNDGLAYAGLALAYARVAHSAAGTAEHLARAKAAAARALELDETLPAAHSAVAQIKLYKDWDWPGADRAFRRTLELNPSFASARAHYAWYLALVDRPEHAIDEMKKTVESDPLAPLWLAWLSALYEAEGQHDEAISSARRALEVDEDSPDALCALGAAQLAKGLRAEAVATHERLAEVPDDNLCLARTYAVLGRPAEAREIVRQYDGARPTNANTWRLAAAYAALEEKDAALDVLERGFELRFNFMPWILWNPQYASLRGEPRFQALVRRLNLPA